MILTKSAARGARIINYFDGIPAFMWFWMHQDDSCYLVIQPNGSFTVLPNSDPYKVFYMPLHPFEEPDLDDNDLEILD